MIIKLASKNIISGLSSDEKRTVLRLTSFQSRYQPIERAYMYNCIAIPSLCHNNFEFFFISQDSPDDFIEHGTIGGIEMAQSKRYTMLRIVVDEKTCKKTVSAKSEFDSQLYQAGYQAYKKLFGVINQYKLGNLVRIWNYVPNILSQSNPSIQPENRERYRQFNAGRADAWAEFGPRDSSGKLMRAAATGIGSHGGPLIIECLVSSHPVKYIENPRQMPAYQYPRKYGSKSPAFARASLLQGTDFEELYISGTASIVGSETQHIGSAVAQVKETFKNITALISSDNLKEYGGKGFGLSDIQGFRVYIKNPKDYPAIRKEVEKIIGQDADAIYLSDDICRKDLLLEIEGVAIHSS